MSIEYDEYLSEHIANVQRGLNWMRDNLKVNGLIDERAMDIACENAMIHDSTKTSSEEYPAYDAYFYGGNRSYKVCQDFDYAWLHHQKLNPHHWQYWILIKDEPDDIEDQFDIEFHKMGPTLKPMLIPLEYVYEMIADWWTFSWKSGNLFEIFKWYNLNSPYMLMHNTTKAVVNGILQEMYKILIMQETVAGHDITDIEKQYMLYFMYKPEPEPIVEHSDSDIEEDKHKYGVPELKKFPMPDKDHVKSAIRFFNYIDPKHEKELAYAILKHMKEYGMTFEDFGVGDENRFKKYIPKEEKKG